MDLPLLAGRAGKDADLEAEFEDAEGKHLSVWSPGAKEGGREGGREVSSEGVHRGQKVMAEQQPNQPGWSTCQNMPEHV